MKANHKGLFLLISFLVFGNLSLYATPPDQYRFSVIDIHNGLTHNQVNCFFRDSRGYIWIGTAAGLNRYDGYHLKVFRHDPKDPSSISDNYINIIFEDPNGFIWVGTSNGFSIYNPARDNFFRDWKSLLKNYGLHVANVEEILEDSNGNYWFVQTGYGVTRYDPRSNTSSTLKHSFSDSSTISSNHISAIGQNTKGDIWLIHRNGILEKINGETLEVIEKHEFLYQRFNKELRFYQMTVDSDGDVWVYLPSDGQGVFVFNDEEKSFSHFHKNSGKVKLSTNLVTGVVEEANGKIWVGTDLGGINVIHKKDLSVSHILHNAENKHSLVHNSVYSLYKDNEGIIWIGAYKNGVNYYHKDIIRFQHYKHYASVPNSLPYDDVNRFAEDEDGNLWIGTNGDGLLYLNRSTGKFTQYKHNPKDPNSLSSDVIVSLEVTENNNLLIGTYMGGLNIFDGKNFIHYRDEPHNPTGLGSDNVWELFEDSKGNIWVGLLNEGLAVYDPEKKTFLHYPIGTGSKAITNNYVSAIAEDSHGNIWVGGNKGIDVINIATGEILHYQNNPDNPVSLISNKVLWILKDGRHNMWVATEEGLELFIEKDTAFRHFTQKDGLPHNAVLTILEANQNNLWVSTPNGISSLRISREKDSLTLSFKNYDECDGLQGQVFNENAALRTKDGEMIFGGPNGFNVFDPEGLSNNNNLPQIAFTDFQLFNKSLTIGKEVNGRIILPKALSDSSHLTLKHNENFFSIEFAAISFFQPEKNKYKYKLIGFDKVWHTADNSSRRITYTNLDPGVYEFKVIASNNDGLWNEKGNSMKITILSPFWKTDQAYVGYAVLILVGLFVGRRVMLKRERVKFQIEQERREARQLHELDLMKIRFFTNISHEFRTPLTLILTPIEKLISAAEDVKYQSQLQLIHRNAKRLLNLVNQLLDFRKIEVEGVKLHASEGNIIKFIRESVHSFADLSEKKNIKLSFQCDFEELYASFDMDKLEKILFNLLSNAFKFTPENGEIAVSVNCLDNDTGSEGIKLVEIVVKDTGIGISEEKHEKVFERFFRNDVPSSFVNQGSGIGLSITKEFVRIHGGTIKVMSAPDQGSSFIVTIPVKQIGGVIETAAYVEKEDEQVYAINEPVKTGTTENKRSKKSQVLLVEDNEDFRFYLKDNLSVFFTIVEAKNGKDGWQKALSTMPELIVSDLMMPEMNGIDFCKKIRNDSRTSHIPFVLLTAHSAAEQKLKGLDIGANDYITKPFNFEILLSRIRNLIAQNQLLQRVLEKKISVQTSEVEITSLDEKLIQDAMKIVEENIEDPDFSVELLSKELGMSRANLYKKMVALTGQSPVEFIRKIRLQRAAQFLEKSQLSVAEVAYKVGFNSTKYFTKYFKNEFNTLPSAYARED